MMIIIIIIMIIKINNAIAKSLASFKTKILREI
jgi:hypothetical protein